MEDNKLWFKNKKYGWGWTPCSWQGWAVLAMYFFAMITNIISINNRAFSNSDFLTQFFPQIYIMTVFLLIICYTKGEKPKWQWGNKNEDHIPADNFFNRTIKQVKDFVFWIKRLIDSRD